jgi:probable phosphoglycerate mutase
MIGASDPPLSAEARLEAAALAAALAGTDFGRVCSSPLARAVETARIVSLGASGPSGGRRAKEIELVEALREVSLGAWEGLTSAEARRGWPEIWKARGADPAGTGPPGGESLEDLAARVWPAFDLIAAGPEENTLVVAHQAVNRVILAREAALPLSMALSLDQPYGAVAVIERP